jgi:hypothetical protein
MDVRGRGEIGRIAPAGRLKVVAGKVCRVPPYELHPKKEIRRTDQQTLIAQFYRLRRPKGKQKLRRLAKRNA